MLWALKCTKNQISNLLVKNENISLRRERERVCYVFYLWFVTQTPITGSEIAWKCFSTISLELLTKIEYTIVIFSFRDIRNITLKNNFIFDVIQFREQSERANEWVSERRSKRTYNECSSSSRHICGCAHIKLTFWVMCSNLVQWYLLTMVCQVY